MHVIPDNCATDGKIQSRKANVATLSYDAETLLWMGWNKVIFRRASILKLLLE